MEAPEDSSITLVENFDDNNINEKNLGTQYIYTTEGQLIPAGAEEIQLDDPHFHADPVIEQVDYQLIEDVPVTTSGTFEEIEQPFIIQQIDEETPQIKDKESTQQDVVQELIEAADGSDKIEVVNDDVEEDEDPLSMEAEPKASRPRGRKPTEDMPLHILGHDVSNNVNGKPRPRLGVKVPYRILSSQIVSKEEIEKEVIERGRKKQQEKQEQEQFAQKLSNRLVSTVTGAKDIDTNGNEEPKTIDNSDLLAILESNSVDEDDPITPPQKNDTSTDETNIKNLEREIALQQLQELPYLVPKLVKPGKTLKVTTPLKTYARKRKSSEGVHLEATPPVKQEVGPVYVTKSSRIIKKKVIWDPDELSPIKKPKPEVKKELKVEVKKEVKVSPKTKKGRSEVDRLLGDEGAIKMLYDLKQEGGDDKRKGKVLSVERTFKDLAKKANQIKTDLVKDTSSEKKNLRKKDSISPSKTHNGPGPVSRQKSKDSIRSTPPPSPGFLPNEVSCLIRRRSSTSIESGAELDDSEERLGKELRLKRAKKLSESSVKSQKKGSYDTFTVKKQGKSVTILLNTDKKSEGYLTQQVLTELTTCLNKLSKEKDCHVVLVKSGNAAVFSQGLDYRPLVAKDTRKRATELACKVRDFLKCLAQFPKCLVAAVQGECVGVACTMLPLFDLVIAMDDAKFRCDYVKLGGVAEAGFLLTTGLAGDLLYANQTLAADDACRRGLVSRVCWPEKYQDIVRSTVTAIAQGSRQSVEATKLQLYNYGPQRLVVAGLDAMLPELVQSWTSAECQAKFAEL